MPFAVCCYDSCFRELKGGRKVPRPIPSLSEPARNRVVKEVNLNSFFFQVDMIHTANQRKHSSGSHTSKVLGQRYRVKFRGAWWAARLAVYEGNKRVSSFCRHLNAKILIPKSFIGYFSKSRTTSERQQSPTWLRPEIDKLFLIWSRDIRKRIISSTSGRFYRFSSNVWMDVLPDSEPTLSRAYCADPDA